MVVNFILGNDFKRFIYIYSVQSASNQSPQDAGLQHRLKSLFGEELQTQVALGIDAWLYDDPISSSSSQVFSLERESCFQDYHGQSYTGEIESHSSSCRLFHMISLDIHMAVWLPSSFGRIPSRQNHTPS